MRLDGVQRLRRDGLPPLRFTGRMIARHPSIPVAAPFWHRFGLYGVAPSGYAAEIVAYRATVAVRCHAALFDSLDGALGFFEGHDPERDICPDGLAAAIAGEGSVMELAIEAATLRAFRQTVVCKYRIGVGEFLAGIAVKELSLAN